MTQIEKIRAVAKAAKIARQETDGPGEEDGVWADGWPDRFDLSLLETVAAQAKALRSGKAVWTMSLQGPPKIVPDPIRKPPVQKPQPTESPAEFEEI